MRIFAFVALLFISASALELNELNKLLYPAAPAASVVAWNKQAAAAARPLRIALVTDHLVGGSHHHQLVKALQARSHEVTVYALKASDVDVRVVAASKPAAGGKGFAHAHSESVFNALTGVAHLDVVVFLEPSLGFVTMQAKRAGLAMTETVLVQRASPVTSKLTNLKEVVVSFMQRQCFQLADVVFTTDQQLVAQLAAAGFQTQAPVYDVARNAFVSFLEFVPSLLQAHVATAQPLVSVVVTTFNRPQFLRECIASLEAQTYANLELIIVDDGSSLPEVATLLTQLSRQRNVKVVRQANKYLGAARNRGVEEASGELVLFLDDDNLAFPQMVSVLAAAMERTGAEIAVSGHSIWEAEKPKSSASVWLPLGPAPLAGLLENVLGSGNFMVRKSAFNRLGRFTVDRLGGEEYEFHAKAALAQAAYVVVPRSLFFYRIHDRSTQMYFETDATEATERALRPYSSLLQGTGHSTRDVHEFRRVAASFCQVIFLSRSVCDTTSVAFTALLETVVITPPSIYADPGPSYDVQVTASSSAHHLAPVFNIPGTNVQSAFTSGRFPGTDLLEVSFTADLSTSADRTRSKISFALNTGLAAQTIFCDGDTTILTLDPPCGNCAPHTSLCACTNNGRTCTPLDFDANGRFDVADLAQLLSFWGHLTVAPNPIADIDGNEIVDIAELSQLIFNWHRQLKADE